MARVLLFAAARGAAGCREAELSGDSLGAVMRAACAHFGPDFERLLGSCAVLVDRKGVPTERWWDTAISHSNEVAVLPPVSGG